MFNTVKIFYNNLSKGGRIVLWILVQTLIVAILVSVMNTFFHEKTNIKIDNKDEIVSDVPEEYIESFKKTLWELISSNVSDVDKNVIDDVVIRDGTYEEIFDGEAKSVTFIIDIDSIKQTFVVSIGWLDDLKDGPDNNISIECPSINQMKYPETICYGMYNNTYSLDLYLPHGDYSRNEDGLSSFYSIEGDESTNTLIIMLSCDVDRAKKEAWDYLDSLPIDFSDYTINYDVTTDVDMEC